MPIPFQDVDEADVPGSAGFLKIERSADGACCLGALFVVNPRGEPLEFAYNRVTAPRPFLWRQADLRRHVERRLTASLLSVCTHQPRLLLCLADEVSASLFSQDITLDVPVGLVGEPVAPRRLVDQETGEVLDEEAAPEQVSWLPAPPGAGSAERRLFDHLASHGLLREPFERATIGLREVYASGPRPAGASDRE